MRTLSKLPKTKQIQKPAQKQKQTNKKNQSKKITKTIFKDPFHYKIETLSHENIDQLTNDFLPYLKTIRKQMPIKQNTMKKKFISFKSQQNQLPTLTNSQVILGVKSVIKQISKSESIQLIVIFYEQNRYELFEQLFCRALQNKIPLIIARDCQSIKKQFKVKTLTCIGLKNKQISHKLSILSTRCSVEIPWLVKKEWIKLNN